MNILNNPHLRFRGAGLFASEKRWIHPRRIEKTYEIIYVIRGTVCLNEGGRDYFLQPGQLILLEPDRLHYGFRESSGVSFYWLHFAPPEEKLPFEGRLLDQFDSAYLFRELLHYNNLPNPPEYLVNAILVRILSEICFLTERRMNAADETAEKIYEWLRVNASAALTVNDCALHFGFSPEHVSRILRKSFGIGAKALIDRFLLLRAKELLCNTDQYVKEIAYQLGFASDSAFISFFRYHEGQYPTVYRRRYFKVHMNTK